LVFNVWVNKFQKFIYLKLSKWTSI
jgi:hypothetical protein